MLSEILKTFRETGGPLSLKELSRRLEVAPGALEGMLETLVRQGKLREVGGGGSCGHCAGRLGCGHVPSGDTMPRAYELVN